MMDEQTSGPSLTPLDEDELRNLVQRIINSGALGRSRTYQDILIYLMDCSINKEQPKEIAIAMDVLGRGADFDVGRDSIVRVHLYHLRSKLDNYFTRFGEKEPWRLEIPKGQYVLVSVPNVSVEANVLLENLEMRKALPRPWLTGSLVFLLIVSLFMPPVQSFRSNGSNNVRAMAPWKHMLDDQSPILIVVGDYYIFGELDATGNVARMVRDFDINSSSDLEALLIMEPDLYEKYYNLGLSYLPVGTAEALTSIMPLLYDQSRRVSVRTLSQLSASDLTENHIIYLGYISGLGLLEDLMFASSRLSIGDTYDELFTESGDYFISDSGIQNTQDDFIDYGMVSTFASPKGQQFVLIAGMRDAGLMSVAEKVSEAEGLQELLIRAGSDAESWEGLFEVFGYDHTSFDANLLYAGKLDTHSIWGGE